MYNWLCVVSLALKHDFLNRLWWVTSFLRSCGPMCQVLRVRGHAPHTIAKRSRCSCGSCLLIRPRNICSLTMSTRLRAGLKSCAIAGVVCCKRVRWSSSLSPGLTGRTLRALCGQHLQRWCTVHWSRVGPAGTAALLPVAACFGVLVLRT